MFILSQKTTILCFCTIYVYLVTEDYRFLYYLCICCDGRRKVLYFVLYKFMLPRHTKRPWFCTIYLYVFTEDEKILIYTIYGYFVTEDDTTLIYIIHGYLVTEDKKPCFLLSMSRKKTRHFICSNFV